MIERKPLGWQNSFTYRPLGQAGRLHQAMPPLGQSFDRVSQTFQVLQCSLELSDRLAQDAAVADDFSFASETEFSWSRERAEPEAPFPPSSQPDSVIQESPISNEGSPDLSTSQSEQSELPQDLPQDLPPLGARKPLAAPEPLGNLPPLIQETQPDSDVEIAQRTPEDTSSDSDISEAAAVEPTVEPVVVEEVARSPLDQSDAITQLQPQPELQLQEIVEDEPHSDLIPESASSADVDLPVQTAADERSDLDARSITQEQSADLTERSDLDARSFTQDQSSDLSDSDFRSPLRETVSESSGTPPENVQLQTETIPDSPVTQLVPGSSTLSEPLLINEAPTDSPSISETDSAALPPEASLPVPAAISPLESQPQPSQPVEEPENDRDEIPATQETSGPSLSQTAIPESGDTSVSPAIQTSRQPNDRASVDFSPSLAAAEFEPSREIATDQVQAEPAVTHPDHPASTNFASDSAIPVEDSLTDQIDRSAETVKAPPEGVATNLADSSVPSELSPSVVQREPIISPQAELPLQSEQPATPTISTNQVGDTTSELDSSPLSESASQIQATPEVAVSSPTEIAPSKIESRSTSSASNEPNSILSELIEIDAEAVSSVPESDTVTTNKSVTEQPHPLVDITNTTVQAVLEPQTIEQTAFQEAVSSSVTEPSADPLTATPSEPQTIEHPVQLKDLDPRTTSIPTERSANPRLDRVSAPSSILLTPPLGITQPLAEPPRLSPPILQPKSLLDQLDNADAIAPVQMPTVMPEAASQPSQADDAQTVKPQQAQHQVPDTWSSLSELLENQAESHTDQPPWQDTITSLDTISDSSAVQRAALTSELIEETAIEETSPISNLSGSDDFPETTLISPFASETEVATASTPAKLPDQKAVNDQQLDELAQIVYSRLRQQFLIEHERCGNFAAVSFLWFSTVPPIRSDSRQAYAGGNAQPQQKSNAINQLTPLDAKLDQLTGEVYQLVRSRFKIDQERCGTLMHPYF